MKNVKRILSLALVIVMAFALTACKAEETSDLWKDAIHTKDAEVGEGAVTFKIDVVCEDKSVTFTINTDAATVGDALIENKLIEGEVGSFGLYIDSVNGMLADYDENMSYWAFYVNDEYAMTGVDMTEIDTSAAYKLEYTIME
ncbi:MAG: DUF4430 domain-containing protein [Clostridia bacterium]|nr:DUF4430 domain-containing protein [Clostridia bacterium]